MAPRLSLIGIVTTDLARSLAFYRLLGLPVPEEVEVGPHVEIEVAPGVLLAWDSVEVITGMDPSWAPPAGGHRVALAFECEDPAEVDAVYEAVVAAGHHGHLPPWDAFWGQRYAVVHDPDGNAVDLYAPLPTD
jgi:catechol 2,3-dioxygenase-like lactoylglutathione lyase family enzyme